jgi:radical SAM protein with 4Fe4S-binding SPASM domain
MQAPDVSWIPGFWKAVRDHVFAREEDHVVILPPNMVYKTNATGLKILAWLNQGKSVVDLPGMDAERLTEVEAFLRDIKDLCEGKAVPTQAIAYGFDFTRLPILGEIAVTYACNNRCEFCYAGCSPKGAAEGCSPGLESQMRLDQILRIVDIFRAEAKIPFFSLTGGEPLLRDDIEEIIAYAEKQNLKVNLITNGTLASPARAKSLYGAGLRTAQVSLESPQASIHDELCGVPGAWERTVKGIEALQAAGISVQTNSTVTRKNRESLDFMPSFLKSLGIRRFSMNLYIPSANLEKAPELLVRYSEIGDFVDEMKKRSQREGMVFFWYSPTPLCIYNPLARGLGNKSCAAADGLVSVNPQGDVLPCSSYNLPLGNLLTQSFKDVWFSARAAAFKQKRYAPDSCRACDSFIACQAACPLYWNYVGYGELAECKAR